MTLKQQVRALARELRSLAVAQGAPNTFILDDVAHVCTPQAAGRIARRQDLINLLGKESEFLIVPVFSKTRLAAWMVTYWPVDVEEPPPVPDHLDAAAHASAAALDIAMVNAAFGCGHRWGAFEHLCHEVGHLVVARLPFTPQGVRRIDGSPWNEALTWAVVCRTMELFGVVPPTKHQTYTNCFGQGVSKAHVKRAFSSPKVPELALKAVQFIKSCGEKGRDGDFWWEPAKKTANE